MSLAPLPPPIGGRDPVSLDLHVCVDRGGGGGEFLHIDSEIARKMIYPYNPVTRNISQMVALLLTWSGRVAGCLHCGFTEYLQGGLGASAGCVACIHISGQENTVLEAGK